MYTQYLDLYLTFGEIQSQVTVDVASGCVEMKWRKATGDGGGGYQVTREESWSAGRHEILVGKGF